MKSKATLTGAIIQKLLNRLNTKEKNHTDLNTYEELEVFKRDAIENKAKHF